MLTQFIIFQSSFVLWVMSSYQIVLHILLNMHIVCNSEIYMDSMTFNRLYKASLLNQMSHLSRHPFSYYHETLYVYYLNTSRCYRKTGETKWPTQSIMSSKLAVPDDDVAQERISLVKLWLPTCTYTYQPYGNMSLVWGSLTY